MSYELVYTSIHSSITTSTVQIFLWLVVAHEYKHKPVMWLSSASRRLARRQLVEYPHEAVAAATLCSWQVNESWPVLVDTKTNCRINLLNDLAEYPISSG